MFTIALSTTAFAQGKVTIKCLDKFSDGTNATDIAPAWAKYKYQDRAAWSFSSTVANTTTLTSTSSFGQSIWTSYAPYSAHSKTFKFNDGYAVHSVTVDYPALESRKSWQTTANLTRYHNKLYFKDVTNNQYVRADYIRFYPPGGRGTSLSIDSDGYDFPVIDNGTAGQYTIQVEFDNSDIITLNYGSEIPFGSAGVYTVNVRPVNGGYILN